MPPLLCNTLSASANQPQLRNTKKILATNQRKPVNTPPCIYTSKANRDLPLAKYTNTRRHTHTHIHTETGIRMPRHIYTDTHTKPQTHNHSAAFSQHARTRTHIQIPRHISEEIMKRSKAKYT